MPALRFLALAALAAFFAPALVAPPARALGPVDIEVAARIGGGSNPVGGGLPNPLGFGLGGRAGASLLGVYGGVNVMYYLGESGAFGATGSGVAASSLGLQSVLYGGEVGYGLEVGPVLIRALFGVGNDLLNGSGSVRLGCVGTPICNHSVANTQYLYLEPSLVAFVRIRSFFIGMDISVLLLPAGPIAVSPSGEAFLLA